MKNYIFLISLFVSLTIQAYSQANNDIVFLEKIFSINKGEINTTNFPKTLTDPICWKLLGKKEDGEISKIEFMNGLWFNNDGLFIETNTIPKLRYPSEARQTFKGIWEYNRENNLLIFKFFNFERVFHIISLSAAVIVLEDENKYRYYLAAQSKLSDKPLVLHQSIEENFLSVNELKEEWNIKKYSILSCEDFSDGLALVSIDRDYKPDDINYGYGRKLYGYIDLTGNYIVPPIYEVAYKYTDGYALVNINLRKENNWEFINIKGQNEFNKYFEEARTFSNGLATVKMKSWGFIDKTGSFICELQYERVGNFKEGLAKIQFGGKWGFIDITGKEIIYPQFAQVHDFVNGLALVWKDLNYHEKQYNYLDKTGKSVISLSKEDEPIIERQHKNASDDDNNIFLCDFNEGYAMIRKNNRTLYIDKNGKAFKPKINSFNNCIGIFYNFVNDFAITKQCGKYGFIKKDGSSLGKPKFEDVGNFSEGLAKVKLNNNWGYIDASGNIVINKLIESVDLQTVASFDNVSDFSDGVAVVKVRNKFGFIDNNGNWIIKPELKNANNFKNGMARVKFVDRNGWNFIDKSGKVLFPNFL